MGTPIGRPRPGSAWDLARRQHGLVSRRQLLDLGLTKAGIRHRLRIGRLHQVRPGIYVVGRPELTHLGRWMAAVLACGEGAVLSHTSAGALWGLCRESSRIEITVPAPRHPRQHGVRVRQTVRMPSADVSRRHRIPVTSPVRTLIDLAVVLRLQRLESAVIAADKLDLVGAERLRGEIERRAGVPGVPGVRRLLDGPTFALTDSVLERRFLRLVVEAGLPMPETGAVVEGFRTDFLWRDLGLVVETDGLRYHRTPVQQARDRRRDNVHAEAGFTPLRFTHEQVTRRPEEVRRTLLAVHRRLRDERRPA